MKQLNKRQIKLLNFLIRYNAYKPIREFAEVLKVSDKTVASDLNVIQEVIQTVGVEIQRRTGSGIKLSYKDDNISELITILNNQENANSDLSVEQRRIEIARNLLLKSKQYITIQGLSEKYYVSRTSIINDLKHVEKTFANFNIELSKSREGTKVIGTEVEIRNALAYLLQKNINYNSFYLIEYQISRKNEHRIDGLANKNEINFFENLLNNLEKDIQHIINEPYYTNLLTHLLIMTKRIEKGNELEEINQEKFEVVIFDYEIYRNTLNIVEEIEKEYNIKVDANEKFYIYQYLISSGLKNNKNGSSTKKSEIESFSEQYTTELIKNISQLVTIDFTLNHKLYNELLLHIKPMLNRKIAGIRISNPLTKQIKREFSQMFFIIEIACQLVEDKLQIKRNTQDELAYLVTYFQSEIEKAQFKIKKTDVLVICHSGYGTAQLLATRLKKKFTELNIVNIVSSSKIESVELDSIDIIISTVKLEINKPYILVSALLRESDIIGIRNLLHNQTSMSMGNQKDIDHKVNRNFMFDENEQLVEELDIQIDEDRLISLNEKKLVYIEKSSENEVLRYLYEKRKKKYVYILKYRESNYLIKLISQYYSHQEKG